MLWAYSQIVYDILLFTLLLKISQLRQTYTKLSLINHKNE